MNRLTPPRPLVIAHRGASGYRPEHSRSAYELALAQGADAVEPDIVATRDGVLVLRHENEISGTTDVAAHREFADRRTTKEIDGHRVTGWFTEDFDWEELSTLRVTERLPRLRGTAFDGREGILRLRDLLELLDRERPGGEGADAGPADAAPAAPGMVAEIKHASYFESVGLPLDELFAAELAEAGWTDSGRLVVECFETTVLGQIQARGVGARYVFLVEASGAPADQLARFGRDARRFEDYLTDTGLAELAAAFDGISVDKHLLLATDAHGHVTGTTGLVDRAHDAGLTVFCWTLRAENQFLAKNLRHPGGAGQYGDWEKEFRLLMRSGLDGVFADQPDLAIRARAGLDRSV